MKQMRWVIQGALDLDMQVRSKEIVFDFAQLRFIDPTAIVVLENLIQYIRTRQGAKVIFRNFTVATEGNRFLDDSGFFEAHLQKRSFEGSALRSTTLPLQNVAHENSYNWIHNTFPSWIAKRVGMTQKTFASIEVCLSEIFNNIENHSGQTVGCVFAQHYPAKHEVMLSISDFGVGIPFNVRKLYPAISDKDALDWAVIEGFTTQSTKRNRGAGLSILMRYVVSKNRGKVFVRSLKASFSCHYAASGPRMQAHAEDFSYPGTLIQLTFRTDYLEPVGEKEEFTW